MAHTSAAQSIAIDSLAEVCGLTDKNDRVFPLINRGDGAECHFISASFSRLAMCLQPFAHFVAGVLAVPLPAEAKDIETSADQIKLTLGQGKGKAAVKALQKQLISAGWKEDVSTLDAMAGALSFSKEKRASPSAIPTPGSRRPRSPSSPPAEN